MARSRLSGSAKARPMETGSAPKATASRAMAASAARAASASATRPLAAAGAGTSGLGGRRGRRLGRAGDVLVPLEDEAQAGEGEIVVDVLDGLRLRGDEAGEAAGRDHPAGVA